MLYIKSYVSGNGKNLVIKEASEVECREYTIELLDIRKEYQNIKTPQGADKICFNQFVESRMKRKAEIDCNDLFSSTFDFEWLLKQGKTNRNSIMKTFLVVSFINADGDDCHFIPCGSTYVVNEAGSTIETIIKISGMN